MSPGSAAARVPQIKSGHVVLSVDGHRVDPYSVSTYLRGSAGSVAKIVFQDEYGSAFEVSLERMRAEEESPRNGNFGSMPSPMSLSGLSLSRSTSGPPQMGSLGLVLSGTKILDILKGSAADMSGQIMVLLFFSGKQNMI